MVNPNNSISRYPQEDAKETSRTKPLAPPGNDRFANQWMEEVPAKTKKSKP